jgi:peptide/nickel transport system ATP-binding protein
VADEPTTALDVIVQDNLLREMTELQKRLGMSMIYISHDIAVIAEVSDIIGVMYAGRLVELGSASQVFKTPAAPLHLRPDARLPQHCRPQARANHPARRAARPAAPAHGCRFHPRCPFATEQCRREVPAFRDIGGGHFVACDHPMEESLNAV